MTSGPKRHSHPEMSEDLPVDILPASNEEYFPPPPELRELFPALDAVAAVSLGGPPPSRGAADDRAVAASDVLAAMAGALDG